jgi:hypothetical protein
MPTNPETVTVTVTLGRRFLKDLETINDLWMNATEYGDDEEAAAVATQNRDDMLLELGRRVEKAALDALYEGSTT